MPTVNYKGCSHCNSSTYKGQTQSAQSPIYLSTKTRDLQRVCIVMFRAVCKIEQEDEHDVCDHRQPVAAEKPFNEELSACGAMP